MQKSYCAVFIDLDGTLLTPEARVSARNEACLKSLHERGVRIVFATRRPIESDRQICGRIHQKDPVITLSGSMIHDTLFGTSLYAQQIPFETMHSILEFCRRLPAVENIMLDESEGFYALMDNPELDEFIGMYGKKPKPFTYDQIPPHPVLSILVHAKEGRRGVYTDLHQRFGDRVHFTYFREYPWIESSHLNSNKGRALEFVCQHLGLAVGEVVAIGDGANDLEMIATAGLGIAMDYADNEVKAVADQIAPHHADDGVAQILERIFNLK